MNTQKAAAAGIEQAGIAYRVECAWHSGYFGSSLIMQEGNSSKISHGCCSDCEQRMLDEIAARK